MFTGIDFLTIILLLIGIFIGIIRGFVGNLIDIIALCIGISLSSIIYRGPVTLFRNFGITGNAIELTCFLLSVLILTFAIIILFELLRKRIDIKHIVDRIFGVLTGFIIGMVLTGIIYITMSSSYDSAKNLQESKFPKYIIKYIPKVYEKTDKIGIILPKMFFISDSYEEEFNYESKKIKFEKLNFVKFENLTCIKCNSKVEFDGYIPYVGAALISKFTCTSCGRISDGCQTFEIFHFLYHQCPIDKAITRMKFDCPRFPNHEWIAPRGPCPVDKKELPLWDWTPPEKY
ncbi:MAG TPA: CvpA family protein [bacterium]|nr:CvpA family protein [bacterium]